MEAEVARRLEEREQERLREEQQHARARAEADTRARETLLQLEPKSIPSGVLTPLLKQHQDLDDELRRRLKSLGRKLWVFRLDSTGWKIVFMHQCYIFKERTRWQVGGYGGCSLPRGSKENRSRIRFPGQGPL